MGHACEWETSMMLRLAPHLVVGDLTKVPEVPFGKAFAPGYRAWVMPDRSEPGHIGTPSAATAEKGEALFALLRGGRRRVPGTRRGVGRALGLLIVRLIDC